MGSLSVSHRKLEWLRRDPTRILRTGRGGSQNSTTALWRAVRTFHEDGVRDAVAQLTDDLARLRAPTTTIDLLDVYVEAFERQGHTVVRSWHQMRLDLGYDIHLSGRVDRIDLVPGGYEATIFSRPRPVLRWRERLAMPLIQYSVATELGAPVEEVTVGTYWAEEGAYDTHSYSRIELVTALDEARALASTLRALAGA